MQDAPGNVYAKQYGIILSNNSINIPLNNLTHISENSFDTYLWYAYGWLTRMNTIKFYQKNPYISVLLANYFSYGNNLAVCNRKAVWEKEIWKS